MTPVIFLANPVTIVTVFFCKFSFLCTQIKIDYGLDF